MYHYKSIFETGLTRSLSLIKLSLGHCAVAIGRSNGFFVACQLVGEGGPNPCFGFTDSIT